MVLRPRPISQREVKNLLDLQQHARSLRRLYKARRREILDRLRSGASVEPGPHRLDVASRAKLVIRNLAVAAWLIAQGLQ